MGWAASAVHRIAPLAAAVCCCRSYHPFLSLVENGECVRHDCWRVERERTTESSALAARRWAAATLQRSDRRVGGAKCGQRTTCDARVLVPLCRSLFRLAPRRRRRQQTAAEAEWTAATKNKQKNNSRAVSNGHCSLGGFIRHPRSDTTLERLSNKIRQQMCLYNILKTKVDQHHCLHCLLFSASFQTAAQAAQFLTLPFRFNQFCSCSVPRSVSQPVVRVC